MMTMRRLSLGAGCAVYALLVLSVVAVSAAALANPAVPMAPAVDPTLDWIVRIALTLLALAAPVQLWLGKALLGTLRAHDTRLGTHDVKLAKLAESKVYRHACEGYRDEHERDCPARQAVLVKAARP